MYNINLVSISILLLHTGSNLVTHGQLLCKEISDVNIRTWVARAKKVDVSGGLSNITKTDLYNFDPLKPHFCIVKLGFTGVYIIFLISAQKHRLWVLVRTASASSSTHNLRFEQKYEKYQKFLSENFQFLVMKFPIYLNRRVFVMN